MQRSKLRMAQERNWLKMRLRGAKAIFSYDSYSLLTVKEAQLAEEISSKIDTLLSIWEIKINDVLKRRF